MIIVGIIVSCVCVFSGYALAGGSFGAIWQPLEVLMIVGAGLGAFISANTSKGMKSVLSGFKRVSSTKNYNKEFYLDLLDLMNKLFTKAKREGTNAIESDVENPTESELMKKYPKIIQDEMIMDFISDYMRLIVTGVSNPHELDDLMELEIEQLEEDLAEPAHALTRVADGMPAFGIVAAVLGVVKALSYSGASAEELGLMIAHALVGTFLGIALAYSVLSPMATKIEVQIEDATKTLHCIRMSIVAYLNGAAPQIAVEFGRKALFKHERPTFIEMEEHLMKE